MQLSKPVLVCLEAHVSCGVLLTAPFATLLKAECVLSHSTTRRMWVRTEPNPLFDLASPTSHACNTINKEALPLHVQCEHRIIWKISSVRTNMSVT